ncbi:MAG: hypothetical protein COA61_006525 [Zetaproteobacteria bacterium]|nr:hypothetical protein [Zetaproteobacteria bacterium]
MNHLTRFSFALTPRMQSFLECRNALQCLEHAKLHDDVYGWLQAIHDLQESLLGSAARKPVVPEIVGLIHAIQRNLKNLSRQNTAFKQQILEAHASLSEYEKVLAKTLPKALDFMYNDGVIQSWINCHKKQDWLGHRIFYPKVLPIFWQTLGIQEQLNESLQDIHAIISHLDGILHDFVPWTEELARHGSDQLQPTCSDEKHGLLIVGLPTSAVQSGITPEFSGNQHVVRIRFQQWSAGKAQMAYDQDLPYYRMLVPIL